MTSIFYRGASLPTAAWDIGALLKNATSTLQGWFGLLIILLGVVLIGIAAVFVFRKLTAGQQAQGQTKGWGTIGLTFLAGGAFFAGGFAFVQKIASGGQKSINDLGNGVISFSPDLTTHVHQIGQTIGSGLLF